MVVAGSEYRIARLLPSFNSLVARRKTADGPPRSTPPYSQFHQTAVGLSSRANRSGPGFAAIRLFFNLRFLHLPAAIPIVAFWLKSFNQPGAQADRWESMEKTVAAGSWPDKDPASARKRHIPQLDFKSGIADALRPKQSIDLRTGLYPMNSVTKPSNGDLKTALCALIALLLVFHVGSALRGRGQFRDIHLGTALHYAQTKISLADTIIVGFNATGTPTIQEFPIWQMVAGLVFKLFGPWWGWANLVSLALFLPCLFPLFQVARLYLDERRAWWVLIFFLAEPLVFLHAGMASTDGFSLASAVWFLYCGVKLVREPGLKWLVPACVCGSLAAVSKLPFFMATGLALFFLVLWQSGFDFKRLGFLAGAGGVAGVVFLLWTHYTDARQANALFPFVDLRVAKGTTMMFWYFGDWHFRLSAGKWIKGGWRILTGLLGSFALVGLVVLALANKKSNPAARCLLAGALLTTLVFSHLVLVHWHYYLMFAPAVSLLCAEGLAVLEMRFAPQSSQPGLQHFCVRADRAFPAARD